MRISMMMLGAMLAGGAAMQAHAAPQYDRGYGGGETFRCESDGNRYRQCNVDTRGGVALVRQLSSNRCVEGRSWGYDRGGVWVSDGCRAEFRTGGGGWGNGNGNSGWNGSGQVLRCESDNGRQRTCSIPRNSQVQLVRQLSSTRCVEGQNWGRQSGAIWVNRGCRGEFRVGSRGNGWNDGGSWQGGGQVFRCESDNGRTRYCEAGSRRVSLQRQLSKAPCIEGRSWGTDRRGVWVSQGCRGEFRAY